MRVLIVQDDRDLALAISEYLELHQVECDFAYTGESGIELVLAGYYDCVILDHMLPKVHGVEVCRSLRRQGFNRPILMLTAYDTQTSLLAGFDAGLDDFVSKPCAMPILLARLQALYRRQQPSVDCIEIADLAIFAEQHRVTRAGQTLKLPPICWKILLLLARQSPNVVSKVELLARVWPDEEVDEGTLNVHLHQLRKIVDKPFEYQLINIHVGIGLSLGAQC